MRDSYLEVTFRHGRIVAAYYYLPRRPGQKSYRTKEVQPGIMVDYSRAGRPIGIEITAPDRVSVPKMNRILRELGSRFSGVKTWPRCVPPSNSAGFPLEGWLGRTLQRG